MDEMMHTSRLIKIFFILLISTISYSKSIISISIDAPITPPVLSYIQNAIQQAEESNAEALIIELDTPGGLLTTTRDIGQSILTSRVPVITYVSPQGSRAASAGTFILYASHLAVMSPGTHLGSATPVSLGENNEQSQAMENKILNDSLAYIESLAQYHDRNEAFARDAVKNGVSITANEAERAGVINFIATDMTDLIKKADGARVRMQSGVQTLSTSGAKIITAEQSLKDRILITITDPSIAYLMLMAGIYGLLIELFNPGSIFPGVLGAICLLIASYSLQIIPINYAGLGLIILGSAFLIAEAFIPSFGLLGIAGIIAMIIGGFFIFQVPNWAAPDLWFMLSILTLFLLGIILLARISLKAHTNQPVSGVEALIGLKGKVLNQNGLDYEVLVEGEIWLATSDIPLTIGQSIFIEEVNGLRLHVKSAEIENE
jgi:membrane-bound serine protease (ClpP class)